jgi:hypothetical protein
LVTAAEIFQFFLLHLFVIWISSFASISESNNFINNKNSAVNLNDSISISKDSNRKSHKSKSKKSKKVKTDVKKVNLMKLILKGIVLVV